jgi:Cof subfamily protein (haloacid dehalogenase superfamily)
MDGTLLRADGAIDPRDRRAIADVHARGVAVTLATGRLASGAIPTARELGITAPLVCADGGLTIHAETGEWLEHRTIGLAVAEGCARALSAHALAPFVMMHDAIHADASGEAHCDWIRVWTTTVHVHARLCDAPDWKHEGRVAMAVGVGAREAVLAAAAALAQAHAEHVEAVTFAVRGRAQWAVLLRPRGISKGASLARLSARLGVAREDVAAVGDWHNDVSMLSWAGRSFAMGQAPESVRASAKETLAATSATGGGVAEAIARWLATR